ncbi:hypothetical protein L9F63_001460 [Diploptera punctata]|uniref:N-acetylneuraminate lyase n=1 Tax=Diploptera punctata TaxID=6984 RepID=A0AAD8A4W5_DIPPU|nr:hypothetical protein L9F63_001460 [Diploptera punctata]
MKLNFRGLIAPVLTPMTNDGSYNILLGDIPRYAKFLASKGVNGILVNGTSGEGPSLTLAERKATTKAWVDAVKQTKQHLMVQVGGTCLKDVEELATHAENIGSDSLLCLPELFNKPATVEDLVRYLKIVGKAAPNTPLLYYHNPSYTGVRINMPQFLEAAASNIPTFAGIKFTDTNIDEGTQCLLVQKETCIFLGLRSGSCWCFHIRY